MLVGLFTCAAVVQLMSKIKVIVPFLIYFINLLTG